MTLLRRIQRCTSQEPKPVRKSRGDKRMVETSVLRNSTGMTALSFSESFLNES